MSTIFPREEKAEQIFDKILENPKACDRLKNTFFEAIPSAEESEGAGTDIPGTVFAAALFNAYENKDLSCFNGNIVSVSDITPESIAQKLLEITNSFAENTFFIADNTAYVKKTFTFEDVCRGILQELTV